MTTPAPQDITVTRGDTFNMYAGLGRLGIRIDITGATVTGQVRETVDDPAVMGEFVCFLANQLVDPGGILITIPKTVTATFVSDGVYDIQIDFADGDRSTFVGGKMTLKKDVTRGA